MFRVTRKLLPCLKSVARLLRGIVRERVRERNRINRSVRLRSELRDDPEVRTRAHRSPEEVRVLRVRSRTDRPVGGDDFNARHLVCKQAPITGRDSEATLACVPPDADIWTGTVGHRTLTWGGSDGIVLSKRDLEL